MFIKKKKKKKKQRKVKVQQEIFRHLRLVPGRGKRDGEKDIT